jgi:sporulation protein YlmC with PRC-barrel domain
MAHYGTLRDTRISDAAEDIRGSHLYGTDDEKLGKIDDVIFDHSTGQIRYVVVDTGGWLSSKKFIVPADRLRTSGKHKDDFEADLTKQQVQSFPPYEQSDLDSEDKWSDYEGRYRSKWKSDPVMHRAGTDRNITPTTQQIPGQSASQQRSDAVQGVRTGWATQRQESERQAEADLAAAEEDTGRVVRAGDDSVVIADSAAGIGGRWDTFQARLRERRKEAVSSCKSCSVGPQTNRDSTDTLKKAV